VRLVSAGGDGTPFLSFTPTGRGPHAPFLASHVLNRGDATVGGPCGCWGLREICLRFQIQVRAGHAFRPRRLAPTSRYYYDGEGRVATEIKPTSSRSHRGHYRGAELSRGDFPRRTRLSQVSASRGRI